MGWFRFDNDVIHNPKIQFLSDPHYRIWTSLLCIASKSRDGTITDDMSILTFTLRRPAAKCRDAIQVLLSANLLDRVTGGYKPHDWDKWQYKSDVSSDRVKAFRKRRETMLKPFHETVSSSLAAVTETPSDTDSDTDSEPEKKPDSCAKPADAAPALEPVIPAFLIRTAPPPAVPPKPAAPPAVIEPAWIEIPTSSWDTKQEAVPITESKIAEYEATYPGVDVRQQLRAMRQWSFDNRPKRKTKTGMLKFINAWLAREQDRPKGERKNVESFGAAKNSRFLTGLSAAADRFGDDGDKD